MKRRLVVIGTAVKLIRKTDEIIRKTAQIIRKPDEIKKKTARTKEQKTKKSSTTRNLVKSLILRGFSHRKNFDLYEL